MTRTMLTGLSLKLKNNPRWAAPAEGWAAWGWGAGAETVAAWGAGCA